MEIINRSVQNTSFDPLIEHSLQYSDILELFKNASISESENLSSIYPLSDECRYYLDSLGPNKIEEKYFHNNQICISLKGSDITKTILLEAYDFFLKAISNFFAQHEIIKKGFITWAQISNYYCSFFSINALLRLQGKVFTRIWNNNLFYVFVDINRNIFYLKKINQRGSNHKLIWKKFYNIYDQFHYRDHRFEPAYKKRFLDNDFDDEVEFRNNRNYKVYKGFTEFWDITDIETLINDYLKYCIINNDLIDQLNSLSTDPDFMYYARASLRVILLLKIFSELSSTQRFNKKTIKNNINDFYEKYLKNSEIKNSDVYKIREEIQSI